MEITLSRTEEGEYQGFDKDSQGERKTHKYFLGQIKIYNAGNSNTYAIHERLVDDNNNVSEVNYSISSFIGKTPFGIDIYSYPKTIREGYLMFQDMNQNSSEYTIEIVAESTKEKIAFKIPR